MSGTSFTPPPMGDNENFNNTVKTPFSDDYNPLDEPVNEKPYSQPNFSANTDALNQAIPEPSYTPPPIGREDAYRDINKDNAGGAFGGATAVNPSLNEVPNEDKKMAAKHLTNLIIDGYEQLHVFANNSLKFSERKINKMVSEGEIDLNAPIVYDYGTTITGGEFIRQFNEQTKDTLVVTDEFKREVKPVLQRVLEKRGAGLTDEQYLIYLFGKDIAIKGVTFFQIKQSMKDVIDTMKEYTEVYKQGSSPKGEPVYNSSDSSNNAQQSSSYSSRYTEPEETIVPPDFGNPDDLEKMSRAENDLRKEKVKQPKEKRNHFTNKKRGRPKKNEDITDVVVIDDDNPLD